MIQRTDYPTYIYLHSNLVLTNWDKQDIEEYRGDKNVYIRKENKTQEQLEEEVSSYYEISEQEHREYEKLKDNDLDE